MTRVDGRSTQAPRARRRLVLVFACICALAAAATVPAAGQAATKLETVSRDGSRDVSFGADSCNQTSTRTLRLPSGARNARSLDPPVGERLTDPNTGEEIAQVTGVEPQANVIRWTVTPIPGGCEDTSLGGAWETDTVTLEARYTLRHRVLTRGTVIARGDAMCKQMGRKLVALNRRLQHAGTVSAAAHALDRMADLLYATQARFDRLHIPRERAASFHGWVAVIGAIADQASAGAQAGREYRLGAVNRAARRIERLGRRGSRYAHRYGFHRCGGG